MTTKRTITTREQYDNLREGSVLSTKEGLIAFKSEKNLVFLDESTSTFPGLTWIVEWEPPAPAPKVGDTITDPDILDTLPKDAYISWDRGRGRAINADPHTSLPWITKTYPENEWARAEELVPAVIIDLGPNT